MRQIHALAIAVLLAVVTSSASAYEFQLFGHTFHAYANRGRVASADLSQITVRTHINILRHAVVLANGDTVPLDARETRYWTPVLQAINADNDNSELVGALDEVLTFSATVDTVADSSGVADPMNVLLIPRVHIDSLLSARYFATRPVGTTKRQLARTTELPDSTAMAIAGTGAIGLVPTALRAKAALVAFVQMWRAAPAVMPMTEDEYDAIYPGGQ